MYQTLSAARRAASRGDLLAAATPSGPYLHGPGGVLSIPGMEPGIVNALVLPEHTLRTALPWMRAASDNPIHVILTGLAASSGSEATAACDVGKTPGNLATCAQVLPFGELRMATRAIQLNKLGRQQNRCEILDPRLIGDPLARLPVPAEVAGNDLLDEKKQRIRETLFAMERDYAAWDISGNPTNTAGSAASRQFYGLETQINVGHQDALANPAVPCPAADSLVVPLSPKAWSSDAAAIVRKIHDVVRRQELLVRQTGLDPVEFVFVMQYAQFIEASYYWPCNYYTIGCVGPTGSQIQLSGADLTSMRDAMQAGMWQGQDIGPYLPIGGKPYRVLFSEYLTETETAPASGIFASDIYFLPIRSPRFVDSQGWISFYEFIDYGQTLSPAAQSAMRNTDEAIVIGGGRFILYEIENTGLCWQWGLVEELRLVVRAPFLAARFTGVRYTDAVPARSGIPGDPNYAAGGVGGRTAPTYQPPIA